MTGNDYLRAAIGMAAALVLIGCTPGGDDPVADPVAAPVEFDFVHEVSDLRPAADVRYGVLENGLRYAILENDTPAGTAAVRLTFNMGSLGEAEDQRGLAHFLEHMAFNGSTNVAEGEMVPLLERYGLAFGPDTNAFTGYETVGYQLDLPEVDEDTVQTGLFLMRETASELLLDSDAIDRERGVILSEERFRNTPISRWQSSLMRFRYPETILADRSPIGTVEVIETAQRERFVDYYENFYVPERAMLAVVGEIDADAIEAKITELFTDWRGPEEARPDPDLGEVNADRPFSAGYFYDPEVFTILTIDTVRPATPRLDSADKRFEEGLASLGDAMLSRRFQTLVNSGQSPFLQAAVNHDVDFSLAQRSSLLAVTSPDRWREALAQAEQELRRALEHGFTEAELAEQLANARSALEDSVARAETFENSALADAIWSSWRYDEVFTHPEQDLALFERWEDDITVEAVNAAFRDLWNGGERLVFLASSLELTDAETAIRDAWKASSAIPVEPPAAQQAAVFAYTDFGAPGALAWREEIEDLGLVRVGFENGVRVTLKQTDFEDGVVRVRVDFGRGELEPRAKPVVDIVTSAAFTASGLEAHSADELDRALAGRTVGLGFGVGDDSFVFSAATTPRDLATQLQVFAASMTAPGWREEGLAQYRALLPEIRRNSYSSPVGVLQAEVSRMIRSGDTRYGQPDAEQAAAIEIADMRAFIGPALSQAPIEITLVGDFEEAAALDALAATFGALPERAEDWPDYPEHRDIVFPQPTETPIQLAHNGPPDQAMVNIYWPTADDSDPRRTRTLSLLNQVFDLKLTERLREAEGFTYSAFNSSSQSDVYPGYGYLWVGVDVKLDNVDATYAAIDELAGVLVAGEISEDEMQRARQPLLEQIEESLENNGSWTSWLSQSQAKPERLDRIRSVQEDYASITREELIAAARDYLDPARSYRVTIAPIEE